ncbi:MAG TPA: polyphenol oxidase family protein [Acidimicrobiales bacterium]
MPVDEALNTQKRGPLTVHIFESARQLGVDAFVTDRFAGISSTPYDSLNLGDHVGDRASDVEENRRRVAQAAGVGPEHLVIVRQIHGADILDASRATAESEADGLATDRADLALAILVADCVPIVLVDSASSHLVAAHAGWRGLAGGVIKSALATFESPSTVYAFIGPSISREAYQVGPEVAVHFSDVEGALSLDVDDRSRLDLRHVASHQLLEGGVPDPSIVRSRQVTDGGEVFFSDRAQRPCGRFALVAKRVS